MEDTYWISIETAAERLDVSTRTIRRLIAAGDISARRFGKRLVRIDPKSLVGTPVGPARMGKETA